MSCYVTLEIQILFMLYVSNTLVLPHRIKIGYVSAIYNIKTNK